MLPGAIFMRNYAKFSRIAAFFLENDNYNNNHSVLRFVVSISVSSNFFSGFATAVSDEVFFVPNSTRQGNFLLSCEKVCC